MSLTPDQIKALLAIPSKRGGRGKGGKTIDTSVRDYETWFKLAHKIMDAEEVDGTDNECSNPICLDPREGRSRVLAEVNGLVMCRYCFLDGFGSVNTAQLATTDG
jgi:hypothetical protein